MNSKTSSVADDTGILPTQRLWTPWRMGYVGGTPVPGCVFCNALASNDDVTSLIVHRGEHAFVILNLYPYNPGHLMVVPYRHVADFTELSEAETVELAAYSKATLTALREVSHPQGFNIGINLGAVAGAGIAEHLHQHVVPRWGGDTNFMPVVGRTRVLPQLLADTRDLLAEAWK